MLCFHSEQDILECNLSDTEGVFPQWHVFSRIADDCKRNREFRVSQEKHPELQILTCCFVLCRVSKWIFLLNLILKYHFMCIFLLTLSITAHATNTHVQLRSSFSTSGLWILYTAYSVSCWVTCLKHDIYISVWHSDAF